MVYGELIKEQIILEDQQTIEAIQEMHFSQKDLQDPNTIKKIEKILKKEKTFKNLSGFTAFLESVLYIALIIVSHGIALLGIFPFVGVLICSISAIQAFPQKNCEKNLKKFEEKVIKLKEKSKEKLESNPKNASKYKEIISNCDKVLKAIQDKKKEIAKKIQDELIEDFKPIYSGVINWLKKPHIINDAAHKFNHYDLLGLLQILKVQEKTIITRLDNLTEKSGIPIQRIIKIYDNMDKYDFSSIPEIKNNGKILSFASNDEFELFYSPTSKKVYKFDDGYNMEIKSLSEYSNKCKSILLDEFPMDVIIEVDKELGYYRLSECPKQVQKKEFPV